jgi:hypothetical protein
VRGSGYFLFVVNREMATVVIQRIRNVMTKYSILSPPSVKDEGDGKTARERALAG